MRKRLAPNGVSKHGALGGLGPSMAFLRSSNLDAYWVGMQTNNLR